MRKPTRSRLVTPARKPPAHQLASATAAKPNRAASTVVGADQLDQVHLAAVSLLARVKSMLGVPQSDNNGSGA